MRVTLPYPLSTLYVRADLIVDFDTYRAILKDLRYPPTPLRVKPTLLMAVKQKIPINFVIGLLEIDLKDFSPLLFNLVAMFFQKYCLRLLGMALFLGWRQSPMPGKFYKKG